MPFKDGSSTDVVIQRQRSTTTHHNRCKMAIRTDVESLFFSSEGE